MNNLGLFQLAYDSSKHSELDYSPVNPGPRTIRRLFVNLLPTTLSLITARLPIWTQCQLELARHLVQAQNAQTTLQNALQANALRKAPQLQNRLQSALYNLPSSSASVQSASILAHAWKGPFLVLSVFGNGSNRHNLSRVSNNNTLPNVHAIGSSILRVRHSCRHLPDVTYLTG
jgi:hypothetical protein